MLVFDKIAIIQVINYRRERGTVNPIREFRRACKPFSPMSCMRHVYVVYMDRLDKNDAIRKFISIVTPTSDVAEIFTGLDAYNFMLKWVTGTMSKKLYGNDHFVLGTVRYEWAKLIKNKTEISENFVHFMSAIFSDAKKIRSYADRIMLDKMREDAPSTTSSAEISDTAAASDTKDSLEDDIVETKIQLAHQFISEAMKVMIRNCIASREIGITPGYGILDTPNTREYMKAIVSTHKMHIGKKLRSSQAKSAKEESLLKPSILKTDAGKVDLAIMNQAILLMQQRLMLERTISTYDHAAYDRSVPPLSFSMSKL